MINFFRKIRKKLADDNKLFKYGRYAIGEIILVVIGILIALSINNWNEDQKDRKAENEALINLKLEFDENQIKLDQLIEKRKTQEKQCRSYLNLITDDTIPIVQKIAANSPNTNIAVWGGINTVLNSLVNSGGIDRIQNDSLKVLLTNWPTLVDRFKHVEERFVESVKNLEEYENSIIPRAIVKEGNYSSAWPGNYYPISMANKLAPIRKDLIEDIKYYNLIANITQDIYIYLINAIPLRDDYKRISQLIIEELNNRGIQKMEN
ncbi:DUF6090 family protein [Muriicola sp. Z0-33]|uniref:DUF6090 family protein n=1 Tax=Muriicola sp. Z0-33 TaxID=2816957 RepID=UPI002236F957|nr:DUF6090 family protein [Muriicola sp. Z0-33]MCW5515445.1 hypothetical protein [Muriicola sp. Z0-33]